MNIDEDAQMILDLNDFIHSGSQQYEYHMAHIKCAQQYAQILNEKLGMEVDDRKLTYIALSHDILKERSLNPKEDDMVWDGHIIPQDTKRYVRQNLGLLAEYGLDDYFNTDIQYHALSAGIFLRKELYIEDPQILYPVMFHSCPIIPIYLTLDETTKKLVDIMMLADKLSSNYLRINMRGTAVKIDLDKAVFGADGKEFNYTFGLYIARLIAQGHSRETQSEFATAYYYKRLSEMNPLIAKSHHFKRLGGNMIWPKRNSQVLKMQF